MIIKICTDGPDFRVPEGMHKTLDRCVMATRLRMLFKTICSAINCDEKTAGTFVDSAGNSIGQWSLNDCDELFGLKKREFDYLKSFAGEAYFDTEVERDQFRSLWTAYCLHNGLIVDTGTYDSDLYELWDIVSNCEEDTAEWSDFDSFDYFMCAYLV